MIPTAIILHHSAGPRSQTAEAIRRYHVDVKGWSDVGYHFVCEEDGTMVHGRPVGMMGAHAIPFNAVSVGVCLIGDNTTPGEEWTGAQVAAAVRLIETLRTIWPGLALLGHRDAHPGHTVCPGVNVEEVFGS